MPLMMRSRVDLPHPDGPTIAMNSPSSTLKRHLVEHAQAALGMRVAFGDLFEFEQGHGSDGSESGIIDTHRIRVLNGINLTGQSNR